MSKIPYPDEVFRRVCDADFNNVMRSVNFSAIPRSEITIADMEHFHYRERLSGREALVKLYEK